MSSAARLRGQEGFTLVELMVAVTVSTVIVGFVFFVSSRLSAGFREQTRATIAVQTARNLTELLSSDLRQTGFLVPNGFRTAAWGDPAAVVPAISVINNADGSGPDQLSLYYADASAGGRVVSIDPVARQFADVEVTDGLLVGDLAVLVNGDVQVDGGGNVTGLYVACVVRITSIDDDTPDRVHFAGSAGPINTADNSQCETVAIAHAADGASPDTLLYRLVARSYRIDPTRKDMSVLQASLTGLLVAGDWTDVAIGVSNLQVATRFYEPGDVQDVDGDGDPVWDWYSSEAQETPDATATRPASAVPALLTLSVEARSKTTNALQTATQPFTGVPIEHNSTGDWAAVQINGVPDASRPAAYRGDNVYRWITEQIDLRNLAVGP